MPTSLAEPPVVVCRPSEFPIRRVLRCPTCKTRRRMIAETFAWYDPTVTCCHCGDTWVGGSRAPRSAMRGWRDVAAAKATAIWVAVGPFDRTAWERWLHGQVGEPGEFEQTPAAPATPAA